MAFWLLVAGYGQAAVVYTWTDAAGVVHYSDHAVPGATVVVTSTPNGGIQAGPNSAPVAAERARQEAPLEYTEFALASPQSEQVFFTDDVVSATLRLEPALKAQQVVSWTLNGHMLDDRPDTVSITLQTLPRGTYAVAATVTDPLSGTARTTPSVTFYVRQPSELSPQHKKS